MPVVQLKIFAVLALLIPALALVSKGGGVAVFYTLAVKIQ
ncbi:putative membrane protein [Bordetella holmesii 70147]|nr:putative membrane protein [Bordetella holmesii 70147]